MASEDSKRILPFLPLDIIHTILIKVPAKSIARFKSVCKEWRNLLKTHYFISEYINPSVRNNSFLLLWNEENMDWPLRLVDHNMETVEVFRYPWTDENIRVRNIIDTCNGLICLQLDYTGLLCVWNPVIEEIRILPDILGRHWGSSVVGFGFSSVVKDYKIVVFYIQSGIQNRRECVQVYSLNTSSWKELEVPVFGIVEGWFDFLSEAVSNDGTIFWFSKNVLISFDIASEVFTAMQLPIGHGYYAYGLSVCKNLLAVHYRFTVENGHPFVHVEEVASEGGNILRPRHRIPQAPDDGSDVLCFWRNEIVFLHDDIIEKDGGQPKCMFRLFNLTNRKERWFDCPNARYRCEAFNFEKSVVSLRNTQKVEQTASEI